MKAASRSLPRAVKSRETGPDAFSPFGKVMPGTRIISSTRPWTLNEGSSKGADRSASPERVRVFPAGLERAPSHRRSASSAFNEKVTWTAVEDPSTMKVPCGSPEAERRGAKGGFFTESSRGRYSAWNQSFPRGSLTRNRKSKEEVIPGRDAWRSPVTAESAKPPFRPTTPATRPPFAHNEFARADVNGLVLAKMKKRIRPHHGDRVPALVGLIELGDEDGAFMRDGRARSQTFLPEFLSAWRHRLSRWEAQSAA